MQGLFVTATDTGVGKSVLSAALVAAMRAAGTPALAYKPVLTGLDDPSAGDWPRDDQLLARVTGMDAGTVAPLRFGPAVSPHLAAQLAGTVIDPQALLAHAHRLAPRGDDTIVVEGVGGLLVPLAGDYLVRDLAAALSLPVLIAARPGLGTINHTLLTLHAARDAGLDVRAVVLTPWPDAPDAPDALTRSNRETIERLGDVEVAVLCAVSTPEPALLARAGATLAWRRWCAAQRGAA